MAFYDRTAALIGEDGVGKLRRARVLVCGLGGVGGHIVEALVRAGVGTLGLLDCDAVEESNLNRQIIATRDTVGRRKTEAARERVLSVNPDCNVVTYDFRYGEDTADRVNVADYDYVADAVDSVSAKILLISRAKAVNVRIISSMGTGNKLNTDFVICDIEKTSVCPLARVMRKELKKRGIKGVDVLYSKEVPASSAEGRTPASVSYVPAVAGLTIAGKIIRDLIAEDGAHGETSGGAHE